MTAHIAVGDISLDVNFKNIKNVHLCVHPPIGRVTVSAPERMSLDAIRLFAVTKLGWIRRQQRKLQGQARETRREFLDNESHFVWGKRYLLKTAASGRRSSVVLKHSHILLTCPDGASAQKQQQVLERWYRQQLKTTAEALIRTWAPVIGVEVTALKVQRMKTKWGSCNHRTGSVLLNTDLAKKPKECLEYVIVHEMVHLLEPTHNARFTAAMDRLMPNWRLRRDLLNEIPVGHQDWKI